ncbi:unnamed protein product [Arctogadus glacialis]
MSPLPRPLFDSSMHCLRSDCLVGGPKKVGCSVVHIWLHFGGGLSFSTSSGAGRTLKFPYLRRTRRLHTRGRRRRSALKSTHCAKFTGNGQRTERNLTKD